MRALPAPSHVCAACALCRHTPSITSSCTCSLLLTPAQAPRKPRRIHLLKPEEQDAFGLQAASSHRSDGAPSSPACSEEPGRAERGISKGRWCPLLSRIHIGAAESTSGTCHPGWAAAHTGQERLLLTQLHLLRDLLHQPGILRAP